MLPFLIALAIVIALPTITIALKDDKSSFTFREPFESKKETIYKTDTKNRTKEQQLLLSQCGKNYVKSNRENFNIAIATLTKLTI